MQFKNLKQIADHFSKNERLRNPLKNAEGQTYEQASNDLLVQEAERLRVCIQKRIDEYYASYTPVQYVRTYGLNEALKAETFTFIQTGRRQIGLYFDDTSAWGKSLITGEMNGWKPWLINDGWKSGGSTPSFDGYDGFHFIEKGIEDWKSTLKNENIDIIRVGTKGGLKTRA